MPERDRPITVMRVLELVAVVLCILTSLISVLLIVFKGGALVQLIDGHERRIAMIEAQGSPKFSEHFKLDDEREARTRADIKRIEELAAKYSDIGAKVDAIRYQMDSMQNMIEAMHNNSSNRSSKP